MTRILTTIVLGFWLLMSVLLVRMTYFPDHSRYVDVPARRVLKSFLEGGATLNTLHFYHKDRKLGDANINTRLVSSEGGNNYRVYLSGKIEKGALEMVEGQVDWRMDIDLENVDEWAGAKGRFRIIDSNTVLDFEWPKGQRLPTFTLKQKDVVVADDASIQPLLGTFMGSAGAAGVELPEGLGVPAHAEIASLIKMKSMHGLMMLAGQKRQAFLLELSAMDRWKARAYFTEAGELALVDLPEGYRFVEPVIYDLVPDYDEEVEEPVPPLEPRTGVSSTPPLTSPPNPAAEPKS